MLNTKDLQTVPLTILMLLNTSWCPILSILTTHQIIDEQHFIIIIEGQNMFFCGEKPTSLDSYFIGYAHQSNEEVRILLNSTKELHEYLQNCLDYVSGATNWISLEHPYEYKYYQIEYFHRRNPQKLGYGGTREVKRVSIAGSDKMMVAIKSPLDHFKTNGLATAMSQLEGEKQRTQNMRIVHIRNSYL
ncbi:hypothetical protein OROHE_003733 [Orobanche hederae]